LNAHLTLDSPYSAAPHLWPSLVVKDWLLSSEFPSWESALLIQKHFKEEAAWEVNNCAQRPSPTFSFVEEGDYLSPTQRIEAIADILCTIGRRILNTNFESGDLI
jgi:hypothetical protein